MKIRMIYKFKKLLAILLLFNAISINAQEYNQVTEVPVFKEGKQLKSAWAGGLNAPQFNEVDLNNNGRKDLFVYDKDAKRYLTFIHIENDEYIYEPNYARNFPTINSWIVIDDYNCDGIDDIFTHGNLGAPQTYKGYYENDVLKFEFDHKELFYKSSSNNSINLYSVSTHRPVFKDINGDGDKDFLGFNSGTLNRIYYYENLRIENNIPCDSLYFDRIDRCWGNVKETGGTSLDLLLGDTCQGKFLRIHEQNNSINRHPGGTVFDLLDNNNDGVYDMILGDATYERINLLKNNGTTDYANMFEQDDSFPSYDTSVDLPIFPAPYVIDIDKDGDDDVIVAPFLDGVIDNYKNVWYYENDGSLNEPFSLLRDDFLVGDMIDVGESSTPSFFDYNNDGKMDLVIGNDGYFEAGNVFLHSLTLYENTGSNSAPVFEFVDKNYLNISDLNIQNLAPNFGDIDNDGDGDLILGENKGRIVLMNNNNGSFENAAFLKDKDNVEIDVGQSSSPLLYDFDGNNTLDLIIGSRDGNLVYYENTGTPNNYEFTFRTDSLGKVSSITNFQFFGHSSPAIADFDGDGKQDLFLGGFNKGIKFYSDIGTDYNSNFTLNDSNYFNAVIPTSDNSSSNGIEPRLKVTAMDISGDGLPEVLIGTNTGGVTFFSQDESIADTNTLSTNLQIVSDRMRIYPNPASQFIQIELNEIFTAGKTIDVSIFNILGDLVSATQTNNNQFLQLDVSSFSNGVYIINLQQANKIGTLKLVKY